MLNTIQKINIAGFSIDNFKTFNPDRLKLCYNLEK
jgi:hypothetical protein